MDDPKVIRRRKRTTSFMSRGREDALEELARSLGHGSVALVHALGCPSARGLACDRCGVEWVGPAVREPVQ